MTEPVSDDAPSPPLLASDDEGAPRRPFAFFPEPFEDELLYSLMARVREMIGLSNKAVIEAFFGKGRHTSGVTVGLPVRLDQVSARLGRELISCADLIDRHTLHAYSMRFLDRPTYERTRKIAADGWTGVGTGSMSFASRMIDDPRRLRFCPDCVQRDRAAAGIAGWRRVHQCAGVFVCPEHAVGLFESGVSSVRSDQVVACPGDERGARQVANPFQATTAQRIASATAWLLAHPEEPVGFADLRERMRSLLVDKDWVTKPRGEINMGDLHEALLVYYGADCLRAFGIDPAARYWLAQTYRGRDNSRIHPLQYLLLLEFLGLGPSDLFDARPGLRSTSERLRRTQEAANSRKPRVGLEHRLAKHRAKVEAFLSGQPDASRSDTAGTVRHSVYYIRKHDRSWLDAVFPEKLADHNSSVDWAQRDQEFADKVLRAADVILSSPDRPRRVTLSSLVKLVSSSSLTLSLPRLPLTAHAIAVSVEDRIAFQRRQIRWAAGCWVREGAEFCTRAKLIGRINQGGNLSIELQPEVDELVSEINSGRVRN